ncbi:MAG: hypothetical protein IKX54_03235 [Lachnospiraceae bacterium]|nr:hypothetical protein [Lachnospiraceae bacterium]
MISVLYLLICMAVGLAIVTLCMPQVMQKKVLTAMGERTRNPAFSLLPAAFILGVLTVTWSVYAVASLFQSYEHPLVIANAIVMSAGAVFSAVSLILVRRRVHWKQLGKQLLPTGTDILYLAASLSFACVMMIASFRVVQGRIIIGSPVAEDFGLHVNVIRSFSIWEQIPAQFPVFTGAGMNYHFFFDFLAGNLEFLGMRLDFAYNVPSVLAMMALYMAVYECAFRLGAKKRVCLFVWLFVTFRSALGFFQFLWDNSGNLVEAFRSNVDYVGKTDLEWWGIYEVNALLNQRHLIFGMAVSFWVISRFLPLLIRGCELHAKRKSGEEVAKEKAPRSVIITAVVCGIALGLTGYANGHMEIATLLVLAVMFLFSAHRIAYVITAAISVPMTLGFLKMFSGSAKPFGIHFSFGYILTDHSFLGVLKFFGQWLGIMILVLIALAILGNRVHRVMLIATLVPIAFAFTVLLSPNVTQNHKYMLYALYWIGILGAISVARLLETGKSKGLTAIRRIAVIAAFIPLTVTGIYDSFLVLVKCDSDVSYSYDLYPGILKWAQEAGVDRKTIFLEGDNVLSDFSVAGFQNYMGYYWQASDAGYDVDERYNNSYILTHSDYSESLTELAWNMKVSYIVINYIWEYYDDTIRTDVLDQAFTRVYEEDDNELIVIYETLYKPE